MATATTEKKQWKQRPVDHGTIKPLVQGNSKLGSSLIWHFSMLAMLTCPGFSKICEGICYAMKGCYVLGPLQRVLEARMRMRLAADFVMRVVWQISSEFISVVRVHVSGDFDSKEYIDSWIRIAKRKPRTEFYAYTRSWAVPDLLDPLMELASLPNFTLFFSCDSSMTEPPYDGEVRRAYLAMSDDDLPPYRVDLVFRNKPESYMTNLGGAFVCPEERKPKVRGESRADSKIKCQTCKLCWGKRTVLLDRYNDRIAANQGSLPVLQEV